MARGAITVKIDGKYDDKDLNRAIKDLNALKTQSGAATAPMAGLNKAALGVGAAFAGMAGIAIATDFLKSAISAAMEEEAALRKLEIALGNVGQSSKLAEVEEGITRLTKMAAVADDELRPAFQTLVTATKDATEAQALLETSLDISAATGRSLESVTLAMAKASNGQISALTRLGVPLDANIVKTKDFKGAVAELNDVFGGQAAAAAKTYAGRMKSISIAADEAKETIGFALLDSISAVSEAFGGEAGLTSAIEGVADGFADIIRQSTAVVTEFGNVVMAIKDLTGASVEGSAAAQAWDAVLAAAGETIKNSLGGPLYVLGGLLTEINDLLGVNRTYWESVTGSVGDFETAAFGGGTGFGVLADGAEDAAGAMQKARTASDLLKASLDRYSTEDDVILAMRALGKAAREAKGDMGSNKTAAIDLRTEFGTAAGAVLEFATANGTSAANVLELWDKGLADLRKKLIKNGVKPSDVDAFINERLWMTRFTLLADSIGTGRAAEAMRLAGLAAGRQAWKGIVAGLDEGRGEVALSAGQLAAAARYAALAELEINSPSKVFYRMGLSAGEGLSDGLTESQANVAAKAAALVAEAGKAALAEAKSQRDQARAAMASMSEGIVGQVLGNVGFSTTDAEGNALTPQQIVQSILGSTANQSAAVAAIASNLGTALPPALLSQILAMPPETAIALANYLGGPEGSILRQTLVSNYTQLATDTETLLGDPMGLAWAKVGDKSAKDMLAEARRLISERAAGFSAWVAKQLETTVDVRVRFNGSGIDGQRASGGPVHAGGTFLVGERGPELFTPSASGSIVPNHALGSSRGGTTVVNINVAATPGTDRRRLGQELHESLAAFYAANGM